MPRLTFDLPNQENQQIEIKHDVIVVGRTEDCDLLLDHESVSVIHATIEKTEDGYRIFDHNSTNGTKVNGRKIKESVLRFGDRVHFGKFQCRFTTLQDIKLPDRVMREEKGQSSTTILEEEKEEKPALNTAGKSSTSARKLVTKQPGTRGSNLTTLLSAGITNARSSSGGGLGLVLLAIGALIMGCFFGMALKNYNNSGSFNFLGNQSVISSDAEKR